MFPLGGITKREVKQIAKEAVELSGLNILQKKESMGICFIGKRPMKEFLANYIHLTPGRFVEYDTGKVVGKHDGMEYYTIGQGAKIGGSPKKYFVVQKFNPLDTSSLLSKEVQGMLQRGDVLVVDGIDHKALFSHSTILPFEQFNWISGNAPKELLAGETLSLTFKARYSQTPQSCLVSLTASQPLPTFPTTPATSTSPTPSRYDLRIQFPTPHRALTAGQIFVLYHADQCLGGVVIQ